VFGVSSLAVLATALVAACKKDDPIDILADPCAGYNADCADYCGGAMNVAQSWCDSRTGARMWPPECREGTGPGDVDLDGLPDYETSI
jgi:hypothetical protein